MARAAPLRHDVEALHARLREKVAELHPLVVTDVLRVFLAVSVLPCKQMLWSLEFAFDEDDGRIAHVEARFADRGRPPRPDEILKGYEVELLLPMLIPARTGGGEARGAAVAPASAAAPGSLVARFLRALDDLGAYRTIESLHARAVDVHLL